MKSKHKALLLSLCAVLLVAASIFGTLAYLTDSETVTNTFAVGKVGLSLDEAKVDRMGNPEGTTRWRPTKDDPEQKYYLLPGHSYTKDPTVTVDADSEESYVRMMVTVSFADTLTDETLATGLDSIFTGYDATKWIRHEKTVSADKDTIVYEYRYFETVDGTDGALEPLFTGFTVPGDYTNEQISVLDGMKINVVAHAIQAPGFDNADEAWSAFDAQHN